MILTCYWLVRSLDEAPTLAYIIEQCMHTDPKDRPTVAWIIDQLTSLGMHIAARLSPVHSSRFVPLYMTRKGYDSVACQPHTGSLGMIDAVQMSPRQVQARLHSE